MKGQHCRLSFFLIIISFIIFQSCKKDPDRVGAEIIPPGGKLGLNYTDTATIIAYSILTDSVRTDETSVNLFGSYTDPVFGRNTASFYTQCRLASTNPDFGPNPSVDSVILTLDYFNYYGDTTYPLTMHVYEMSKQIFEDSTYFSNYSIPDYGIDYANFSFFPKPKTPIFLGDDTVASSPRLMINLGKYSTELGDKILNADSAILADNDNFLDYFYGLHITADPVTTDGSIIYFNLESAISNLAIYYHNDTVDSLSFVLNINEKCARYSHFEHNDYAEADQVFKDQVLYKDTLLGNDLLYLQSMAGVHTKIFFPYIYDWFETEKIVVNEARLVIPVEDYEAIYSKPPQLKMYRYNEDGTLLIMVDDILGGDYFGGEYNAVDNDYSFRITRYIQQLMLHDYKDYGLQLIITGIYDNAYRTIITGPDPEFINENRKLKLEISYTIVD